MKSKWILAVLLCGLWSLGQTAWQTVKTAAHPDSIVYMPKTGGDPGIITVGLRAATPPDVLSWWTGPWVARHFNDFYRPATSTVWWLQYRAFGEGGFIAFQAIHATLHLAALFILTGFFSYLFGRLDIAALGVCLFTLNFPRLLGLPASYAVQGSWHEDPDVYVAIFYTLSCWCFTRVLRSEQVQWMAACTAAFLIATWFKEMAYSLPFMAVALLWHERKLVTHWRYAAMVFVAAAFMFALRWHFLHGYGYRFGSNGSWLPRWVQALGGGTVISNAMTGDTLPCAFCFALWAAGLAWRKNWTAAVVTLAVALGSYAYCALRFASGMDDSQLLRLLVPEFWSKSALLALLIFVAWRTFKEKERGQIFSWLWVAVAYIPAMTTPLPGRGEYLPSIGWSLFFAYTAADIARYLKAVHLARKRHGLLRRAAA